MQRTTALLTLFLFSSATLTHGAEQAEPWDFNKHLPPYVDLRARRIPQHEARRRSLYPRQSQNVTILPTPGQPTHTISDDLLGGFEVVGNSGVSAQQLFLGTETLVRQILPNVMFAHKLT